MKKPVFVLVGAMKEQTRDGSIGGQMHACRTLLASELSDYVSWRKVDSTNTNEGGLPARVRIARASGRVARFISQVVHPEVDGVFIFTSAGLSFVEKGTMALLAAALGKRVLLGPRSGLLLDDLQRSAFMRRFIPFVLHRCDVVICQGASWQETFERLLALPAERCAIVPNWLEVDSLQNVAANRRFAAPLTFVIMGRLEVWKGIFDLLEAIALQREALQECRFVLCGGGSELEPAQQRAAELGIAHLCEFRGWLAGEAKEEVWRRGHVLVLPSHREGMPNAVLEGMAAGLAIIATQVGGVPDILVDDSVGVLVPARDPAALGRAMAALASAPERAAVLAHNARAHVARHHDIHRLWPRILHALDPAAELPPALQTKAVAP